MLGQPSLTELHLDVAFGRAGGKIIWQPRILAWFDERVRRGEPIPGVHPEVLTQKRGPAGTGQLPGVGGLPEVGWAADMYRALGCSNRIYDFNTCFVSQEDERVRVAERELSASEFEVVWRTPVGRQRAVYRRVKETSWQEPVKWPIGDEEEMMVAAWREERRTWSWDQAAFDRLSELWSGLGAPTMYMPRGNVQRLFIDEMGVERGIYALLDWPGTCARYFEALEASAERLIDVINASPVQLVNFGDNVHAGFLPPEWFQRYVLPVYQRRCERLHAAGKFISAHWDGDCGPLLPFACETGLDGIEAITPQPQGDVTLEEVKEALGEMFLLDGIPAVYFDRTFGEETLIECAKKVIDLFAPNLILGISDEISAHGEIERIPLVGGVVDAYNAGL